MTFLIKYLLDLQPHLFVSVSCRYLPTPVLVFKQFNLVEVKIAVLYYEEFQIYLNTS